MESPESSTSLAVELPEQKDKSLDVVQFDNMVGLGLATKFLVTYSVCHLACSNFSTQFVDS